MRHARPSCRFRHIRHHLRCIWLGRVVEEEAGVVLPGGVFRVLGERLAHELDSRLGGAGRDVPRGGSPRHAGVPRRRRPAADVGPAVDRRRRETRPWRSPRFSRGRWRRMKISPARRRRWACGRRKCWQWARRQTALDRRIAQTHQRPRAGPRSGKRPSRSRCKTEASSLSINLASTYEEISLLHRLTQNLKLSKSDEDLGQVALEWMQEVVPAAGLAIQLLPVPNAEKSSDPCRPQSTGVADPRRLPDRRRGSSPN